MLKFLQPSRTVATSNDNRDEIEQKIQDALKNIFKLDSFRPNQHEIVRATLIEKNDVFVLMPTGAGKSLCYQLPGVVNSGVTLVVSPLIALMHDQVTSLQQKGVKANFWNSTQRVTQIRAITEDLESGSPALKLLYITPESIATEKFRSILRLLAERKQLSLVAIDEAHCISSWGHDFRPKYRSLSDLKKLFPTVPIIALTATATPKVKSDIINILGLKNPKFFVTSFNRPEITYEVRYKELLDSPIGDLKKFLEQYPNQTGIIYCRTKKQVDELCAELSLSGKILAKPYHAGLKLSERKSVQDDWASGKVKLVVATIAFGMGIDKKDVRYVVHWSLPKSIEGFYQESGRAGRDKKNAYSLMYYCTREKNAIKFLLAKSSDDEKRDEVIRKDFDQVCTLCEKAHCRRKFVLEFFGETVKKDICKGTCDYCKDKTGVTKKLERLNTAQKNATFTTVMGSINPNSNYSASDWDDIGSYSDEEFDDLQDREEDAISDKFAARLQHARGPSITRATPLSSLRAGSGLGKNTSNFGNRLGSASYNSPLLGGNGLLGSGNLLLGGSMVQRSPLMSMRSLKKPTVPTNENNKRPRQDDDEKNNDNNITDIFQTLRAEERIQEKVKKPRMTYAGVRTMTSVKRAVTDNLEDSSSGFVKASQLQKQAAADKPPPGTTGKNGKVPNNRTIQSFMTVKKK